MRTDRTRPAIERLVWTVEEAAQVLANLPHPRL